MKDWTRKIIGLSLVALFAGYYGGTTLFYHAHEIDGVKIVHSHPYTGDAQHHAHSAASCRTIQLLSGLTFLTSALALLPRVFRQLSARQQEHLVAARQQWENHPFSCAALPGRLSFSNRYPNEDFARLSSGRSNPKTVCDRIRPIGRVAIVTQYSRKRKRT